MSFSPMSLAEFLIRVTFTDLYAVSRVFPRNQNRVDA